MKSNLSPILKRELQALFYSPVAWFVLCAFYALAGFFWAASVAFYSNLSFSVASRGGAEVKIADYVIAPFFGNVSVILMFLLPLASMRLLSEEKKMGTIETLFTLPFSDLDIILGKWLAGMAMLLAMYLPTLAYPALIADKTIMPWAVVASGYLGLVLIGGCFLAVGLFTSSLTENQVVSAALSFGSILFLFILGWLGSLTSGWIKPLLEQVAIMPHFQDLTRGVINLKDLSYFIFFTLLMLFGTLRVLESKKWR